MAPGTRVPSAKISVGVPVMLVLLAELEVALRAPRVAGAAWCAAASSPSTIQSSQALALSLAHQMLRDLSVESAPRIG